jgi:AbrB family looped-hinge helix DNA binding protein
MAQEPMSVVRLGRQGRLVVPAELRRSLDLHEGSELTISTDGRRLIMEPRAEVLRRVRGRFARVPANVSLTDELLAERREEARRESEG